MEPDLICCLRLLFFIIIISLSLAACLRADDSCGIFAFSDSITDTGNSERSGNLFARAPTKPPYGETYFQKPSCRFSDGRLIIDEIALSLQLPFLNPFQNLFKPAIQLPPGCSNSTDFSNGVNYAVSGSTALNISTLIGQGIAALSTDSLDVQLQWHLKFLQLVKMGSSSATFPTQSVIQEGIYFFQIGENDIAYAFTDGRTTAQVQSLIPSIVAKVVNTIQILHANGAHNFFIMNTPPEGCLPVLVYLNPKASLDDRGCVAKVNAVNDIYNSQLQAAVESLSESLPDASFTILDLHGAFREIQGNPERYGITNTKDGCCGASNLGSLGKNGFSILEMCNPMASLCSDPNTHINWDGFHYTDNFNRQVVKFFVEGRYITPSDALHRCGSKPQGRR